VADADGRNVRQLTFDGRHDQGLPAVCDGGRAVVSPITDFDGKNHLWKLDLQSGKGTDGALVHDRAGPSR
jgi:hypothetical protein